LFRIPRILSTGLLVSLLLTAQAPALGVPQDLTILHTNDTHDHLLPFDTRHGRDLGGIARRATLIRRIRAEATRSLVLDAGDTFQGTPIFTFFEGEADTLTMDLAGYDASTVGNHDLDNGLPNLQKQLAGHHFRMICSNLVDQVSGQPIFEPSHVFERDGLKIGVFGIMGEDALEAVARKNRPTIRYLDPVEVAREQVRDLRSRVDLVVMLSHSGFEQDLDLASRVEGIHLILGGHSHTRVDEPRPVRCGAWTTYVAQDFQWGELLGRIDLTVDEGRITALRGRLLPVDASIPADRSLQDVVNLYDGQIRTRMAEIVAQAPAGLASDDKYARDCELGNWTADVIRGKTGAEIGIMNAGGLRAPLLPGPVSVGTLYSIFPFDNALVTVSLPGKTLQALCDANASDPARLGALQFSNLTFRASGGRAVDVRVGDRPLDPGRDYRVGTIDYLADGNDGYRRFKDGKDARAMGVLLRDAVLEAARHQKVLRSPGTGRIRG